MGSVIVNHPRSDHLDTSSYNMLGGAIPTSESGYRSSSQTQASFQQPSSRLETGGGSRSASSNTTPTSSTAPPSTSASARLPSHQTTQDVPPYIYHPSDSNSYPSSRASSTISGITSAHPNSASMTTTTSDSHPSRFDNHTHAAPHTYAPHVSASHAHATAASTQHNRSHSSPASPQLRPTHQSLRSLGGSEASSPSRIKVRDLSHIQSFASEEMLAQRDRMTGQWGPQERQYEISSMPVTDIIEMVAGLLTKITTTNDMHHEHIHRHIPPPDGTSNLTPQAASVLAFHGKNVPSISILSYLTRIHKYCPTTYEVFLSLLVYFDRMTELVNRSQLERLRRRQARSASMLRTDGNQPQSLRSSNVQATGASPLATPPSSASFAAQEDPSTPSSMSPSLDAEDEEEALSHFFIVDSFNIHRLVIAGVTCASKFFSDVFYTNSRYAKVGGLPLVELNHLELQFLLLNDFRLSIPVEELEAYGTMLVEFYAREIVSQQQQQQQQSQSGIPRSIHAPPAVDSQSDGMYMRTREKHRPDQPEVRQTPTPP
ncbi:putative cyclin-dependent protein kinase complex component [Aspergillus fijiensis CBS 313.89]|uniref:Cyclin-domain-containing protein n=1 Tax=Aspergillus fijiensis CBS 313.89 TaxID=1448319 RepID=A0A8G1RGJ1_9EURO|nr:cyclin-domain-containing protein [Aspergillus fijiensis CBS 313.89]RAK71738.1 cyclin-domain-containing protein [Aspergillus fijiensis CBS 313.89]